MPSNYIENKRLWDNLSEIDYFQLFVSAWLSLNAWYRNVYDDADEDFSDRDIINKIKDEENSIRNAMLPKLKPVEAGRRFAIPQEEESFRTDIALLHSRLSEYELYTGKGVRRSRVTFSQIFLREFTPPSSSKTSHGIIYSVAPNFGPRGGLSSFATTITGKNGIVRFSLSQPKYNIIELSQSLDSSNLTSKQKEIITVIYRQVNPKRPTNLLEDNHPPISCGSLEFKCRPEDLFAGVIEILYQMRCHLFHGELVPNENVMRCYEPAYRLLKYILQQIR